MKKSTRIFAVMLTLLVLSMGLTACGSSEIKELKIGYTDYEPMNYYDGDKFVGFDTEFAERLCADLGYTPKFIEINWETKATSLETGEIDCIWNGMTITDDLLKVMLISDDYLENKQVIVVRKGDEDRFKTVADLASAASIAFETGSAADTLITENTALSSVKKVQCSAQRDTLLEVKSGQSDVSIIDYTMARSMTGEGTSYSDLTFIEVDFPSEKYGIGIRKTDTELYEDINEKIAEYKENGFFDTLINKYINE